MIMNLEQERPLLSPDLLCPEIVFDICDEDIKELKEIVLKIEKANNLNEDIL